MQDYQACLAPSPIFLRQSARADTSGPQLGMRAAECELLCSTITFGDLDLTPPRPYAPTPLRPHASPPIPCGWRDSRRKSLDQ
jgi:hypothetical protein